ncbi:Ig-like domain-containing protein [Paenibacillus sp. Marseille-Q4541]|uniref:Ig-like domain-containing protein n=1 Tax=Paenibacillus sp. Marseille-Q4541 TaxID=2831522 RepID=UPI001BA5E0DA|nr:Ig-like domain-containing protein [Paenibacillus sp. Marseille-Q4541]
MNQKRNRKSLCFIGYFTFVIMLVFSLTATSFVPVADAAAGQTLTLDKLQYFKGESITLSYTGAGANGTDWVGIYKTGDVPPGAGVSLRWVYLKSGDGESSLSNGLAPGTYDALFMLDDGYEIVDRKTFEVVERVPVNGVTLDQQDIILSEGETRILTAMVTPANANDTQVSWTSSDPAVVSVTSTGDSASASLIGNSAGKATVTVMTSDGNFTSSADVTVEPELMLQSLIESAQAKYDAAVEGNEDGLYTPGSKARLQLAIEAANGIANDSNATKEQIDIAKTELRRAIQEFDKKRITADVNGDGRISIGDLAIVAGGSGKQQGQENWIENADVNHDGKVDTLDLEMVAKAILQ